MTHTIKAATILRESDSDESIAYRAISPLAVLSLLMGIASALALVHPGMWFVPPISAATAAWALRGIAARQSELIGRKAALIGLGLAILFGGWAPARLISRQTKLCSEGRARAKEWLRLVREERLYEAYELHLKAAERQPASVSLAELYGDLSGPAVGPRTDAGPGAPGSPDGASLRRPPPVAIREFYDLPGVKALIAAGKDGELAFQGYEAVQSDPETSSDNIILRFEARVAREVKPLSHPLRITLTRTLAAKVRKAQWLVESVYESAPSP